MVENSMRVSSISAIGPTLPPPIKEGWASKYKNVLRGYKKRWLVLEGEVLYFFENKEKATQAQSARLSKMIPVEEKEGDGNPKESMLELNPPTGKKKKIKGGMIALRVA